LPERTVRFANATPIAPAAPSTTTTGPAEGSAPAGQSSDAGVAPANDAVSLDTQTLSDADKADFIGDAPPRVAPRKNAGKPSKSAPKKSTRPAPIAAVDAPSETPPASVDASAPEAAPLVLEPAVATSETPADGAPPADPSATQTLVAPADILVPTKSAPPDILAPVEPAQSQSSCDSYRAIVAATADNAPTAADLNAGMLARLRAAACAADGDSAPPSTN
jgi:hypothetical protein